MVANFKQTDIDPRELILLFKELYESSYKLRDEMLMRKPAYFMPKIIEQVNLNTQTRGFQPLEKLTQAKRHFLSLFEVLNAKFAGELKKDLDKEVKFLYSKFSPVADCIRQEKILLKDMLNLVQTNLIKLYVDLKEKDKLYLFFQNYQRQIVLDAKELEGMVYY